MSLAVYPLRLPPTHMLFPPFLVEFQFIVLDGWSSPLQPSYYQPCRENFACPTAAPHSAPFSPLLLTPYSAASLGFFVTHFPPCCP